MSSFQPSSALRQHTPTSTQNVLSTTSQLLSSSTNNGGSATVGSIESHPTIGKWYMRNYGLGPKQTVKYITRRSTIENRYTSIKFRTGSGLASIQELNFSNSSSSLVVASGPRVSLYGGLNRSTVGTSDFTRALKAGSATQRRNYEDQYNDDEDDDASVDLFGGKSKPKDTTESSLTNNNLDSISCDRNISTGGLLAS